MQYIFVMKLSTAGSKGTTDLHGRKAKEASEGPDPTGTRG